MKITTMIMNYKIYAYICILFAYLCTYKVPKNFL